jgi:hypothetical protein
MRTSPSSSQNNSAAGQAPVDSGGDAGSVGTRAGAVSATPEPTEAGDRAATSIAAPHDATTEQAEPRRPYVTVTRRGQKASELSKRGTQVTGARYTCEPSTADHSGWARGARQARHRDAGGEHRS